MKRRTAARLGWSVATVEIAAVLGSLLLHVLTPNGVLPPLAQATPLDLAENLTVLADALIGGLLVSRQPRNPLGWLFLAVGFGIGFADFGTIYVARAGLVEPGSLPMVRLVGWMANWVWALGVGTLPFFTLLFPTGRPHSPRWRPAVWAAAATGVVLVVVAMAVATQIWAIPLLPERAWPPAARSVSAILFGVLPAILAIALLGAVSMMFRYRTAPTEERQQLKWVIVGVVVLLLALVIDNFAEGTLVGVTSVIGSLAFYTALAIAILKYRLYDIDIVMNKALVYGALAVFISLLYVGVVVGIGSAVGAGEEGNLGLQIGATALVAILFQPARSRVQHLANRLVYGARSTPYEVMAEFGERMGGSLQVEEVLPQVAEAAARGLGAAAARVRVELEGTEAREARWPDEGEAEGVERVLPVTHRGERVGEIAVTKAPGDPPRPQDETLLEDLAAQAGLALYNVRLAEELRGRVEQISRQAEELRASQQRIVTAADDARRLLERTIEARVERRIDDLAERLSAATGLIDEDPDRGAAALEEAGVRAQATLEELREIARGIYPPLLADKGLAAALDAQARREHGTLRLRVEGMGRYSQEIEAGIYFCCLEAIQQGAEALTIDVGEEERALRFAIELEDGLGGERLVRIADRVEALGGELVVGDDAGTAISATIPLDAAGVPA